MLIIEIWMVLFVVCVLYTEQQVAGVWSQARFKFIY